MDWHSASEKDALKFDPAQVFRAGLSLHHLANTAYPIAHLETMRPYRLLRSQVQTFAPLAWQEVEKLGLYVHIPFCEQRCGYCEYTVLDPACKGAVEPLYYDLLLGELELYRQMAGTTGKRLVGFDIGGGTPTLSPASQTARVLDAVQRSFSLPASVVVSIETTPKIAAQEPEKMQALYRMGIHRISMGVQTINPRLLAEVGRTSTSLQYNCKAAENIRRAGFNRFNIDVMYGFAHQPSSSLEATLSHVLSLEPEYITLYRMRYKGTRLASQAQAVGLDEVRQQASLVKELLAAAGYRGAPGKNTFSRRPEEPGTSDYLSERVIYGTPYLGLGLGAQSLSHKTLAYNSGAADKQLRLYNAKVTAGQLPIQDLYHLSLPAAMGKMISVSFYFGEINLAGFRNKFGLALEEAFPVEVTFVLEQGLMEYIYAGEAALRLTEYGADHYNGVIALFYAGAVKEYLLNQCLPHAEGRSCLGLFSQRFQQPSEFEWLPVEQDLSSEKAGGYPDGKQSDER